MAMIDVTPESGVPETLEKLLGEPAPSQNGTLPRVLIALSYGNRASQARFADTLAREVAFTEPPVRDCLTEDELKGLLSLHPAGQRGFGGGGIEAIWSHGAGFRDSANGAFV